jgi:hypothetical protein
MKASTAVRKLETELSELEATFQRRMQFIDQFPGGYRAAGQVIYSNDVYPILTDNPEVFIDETVNRIFPRMQAIRQTLLTVSRLTG